MPAPRVLEGMSGKTHEQSGAHFQVPSQSGGSINNVGGNLYVGEGSRRSESAGRVLAALGLALFFAGLFLLGAAALNVYEQTNGLSDTASLVVPGYTFPAVGLVLVGIAVNRFGRIFTGR